MSLKPSVGNKVFEAILRVDEPAAKTIDTIFQSAFSRSNMEKDWDLHNIIDGEVILAAYQALQEA